MLFWFIKMFKKLKIIYLKSYLYQFYQYIIETIQFLPTFSPFNKYFLTW